MFNKKKILGGLSLTGLIVLCAVMVIALGGISYLYQAYKVEEVYVEGNVHYTEEEIKEMVMNEPLSDNSLYLSLKYKDKDVDNIPFVDVMNVTSLSPHVVKITVYEKALAGYIKFMDTYMYFDKDGYVVENSSVRTLGIPQITGLAFDYAILGEPLPVKDPKVFDEILNLTNLFRKYELEVDKIRFHTNMDVTLHFGDVKVALGRESEKMEDKIMLLPSFLPTLEGKSGTLRMENYDSSGGKYTFKPETREDEDAEDGEDDESES